MRGAGRRRVGGTARVAARSAQVRLTSALGGAQRTRVVVVLACVLGLSGADTATVGAAATQLRHALHISNTDIGLLVTVASLVGALATLPFGVLADRTRRTRVLGVAVGLWAAAMLWSATAGSFGELLRARVFLGAVTAAAGPLVASLIGDYFGAQERGRVYGYILAGETLGAGFGFAVTGDVAALSWRLAFVVLAVPAVVLAVTVFRLPEPARGGHGVLPTEGETESAGAAAAGARAAGAGVGAAGGPSEHAQTDAQRLARERGITADPRKVLHGSARRMNLLAATRYVLGVRTNVILIIASACGYYFFAGVETFGIEFTKEQYGANQAVATLVLLIVGVGAIGGVLAGGYTGDALLRRRHLTGRVSAAFVAAGMATVLFVPAIFTRSLLTAVPYLVAAAFFLQAQNPPLDAARLDIMPPLLWGRAESVRTLLRSLAQAIAPLVFGAFADNLLGGGRTGLEATFAIMLVPLAASAVLLYGARRSYPADVATAAAAPPPRPPVADRLPTPAPR